MKIPRTSFRPFQVRTLEIKYSPPQAKITTGVQTAGPGGRSECSPSCRKPPDISQNARLTITAAHNATTVLFRPKEIASGIPINAITTTLNGDAYLRCKATASAAVSAPRTLKELI